MKIKNLLLLGLLTFGGMNVFAQGPFVSGGVVYKYISAGKTANTANVTVQAISTNTNGKAIASAKSLTIPKTVTAIDNDETWTLTVTGFESGWANATGYTNVTKITTLSVDISNFPSGANMLTAATDGMGDLKSLTSLTVKGTQKLDMTIPDYTYVATKLVTLDLDELVATGKTITLTAQTAPTKPALTTVSLPAQLTAIPDDAFKGQKALTSIDLSNVTSIGDDAFNGCAALDEVTFGKGLTSIGATAFAGTKMTTLALNKCAALTTANVDYTAFPANAWTSIKLAGSQVSVSQINLTKANASLKKITISAHENAALYFAGFTVLKSVVFDAYYDKDTDTDYGITDIAANAFGDASTDAYCPALATVELPYTLKTIGKAAFEGSGLTAIEIPVGVTSIGAGAFKDCAALADLTFEAPAEGSKIKGMTINKSAFEGTAVTKVKLTANVKSLKDDAFKDCTSLKSFSAERVEANGLQAIGVSFDGCENLKSVTLPGTVQSIAANAFKGLEKLATVTFGHNSSKGDFMNSIGASAFEGCIALTAIDLSATGLQDLSQVAVFKGCKALTTVALPRNPWPMAAVKDLGASMFEGTAIEELDASMVQGTINNIFNSGAWPLKSNTTLKTLKLGSATIAANAFAYSTALETLEIGSTSIGSGTFANCTSLATVTMSPDAQYQTIAKGAFDKCSALTTFTYIPNNLDPKSFVQIDGQAFSGCTPYVLFDTNNEFATDYEAQHGGAPVNTRWSADLVNTVVKTVADKANPSQFVAKFWSPYYNATFNASDVKLYSVYMDGETAYYQACRADDGKYYVWAGDHVILKTAEEAEVAWTVTAASDMGHDAVAFDDMVSLSYNGTRANLEPMFWNWAGLQPGEYIYRLTNTADQGFGFTAYNGTSIKANQFFVASTKKPEGAARLNVVWLDEDGNVENDATAIQKIQNTEAENGAIYNLQGVRVNKAQKGLYIQNGKKFIVK